VAPLSEGGRRDEFHVEGQPNAGPDPGVELYMVTPGYFETLGIPRVAGRDFTGETIAGHKMAVVNEAFVQRLFKNESAIGRRVTGGGVTYQIAGVVKNIKARTLGEELQPILFRSLQQSIGGDPSFLGYTVLIRSAAGSAASTAALAGAVRREIHSLDPTLAIFNAETMEEHLRNALFLPRLAGTLFGVFGFVGLLLAAVGLYGVMSYSVGRRMREIGIRLALGAQAGEVRRLIVRQGMLLTLIAVALGLAAAWAVAQFSASFLYGVRPHDLVTFAGVPLFLAAVAFLACWIPARRAASVDPLTALRHE
jgi:predicted permease